MLDAAEENDFENIIVVFFKVQDFEENHRSKLDLQISTTNTM